MNDLVQIGAVDARALTDQIKVAVEATWELVKRAYMERAWAALGYDGWDDYCTREFGTSRLRLPREERTEVVASLRESGLSVRAIAAATGTSYGTVRNAIAEGEQNCSPQITGTDGKTYSPRRQTTFTDESGDEVGGIVDDRDPDTISDQDWIDAAYDADALNEVEAIKDELRDMDPQEGPEAYSDRFGDLVEAEAMRRQAEPIKPKRRPITDAFDSASYELRKAVERVVRLSEDDRLAKNKDQISGSNLSDLVRVRDAINGVINTLEG